MGDSEQAGLQGVLTNATVWSLALTDAEVKSSESCYSPFYRPQGQFSRNSSSCPQGMRAGKETPVAVNKGYCSFSLISFLLLLLLSALQLAQLPWHGWAPGTDAVLEGGLELHCFLTRQFKACLSPGTVLQYHKPDTLVMWNLSSNRLVVYESQKEWSSPELDP